MLIGLLAGVGAALLFGIGAVLQAGAARRAPEGALSTPAQFVVTALRSPLMLAVVAAYLVGFGLHAVAIQHLPLYLAQASIALSLPVTALAVGLVGERVTARQATAVVVVVTGLLLLSAAAGDPGGVRRSWTFAVTLAVAAVLFLLLALVLRSGPGFALATLAGLAYAGSAIAVRDVAWPPWADLSSTVALGAVGTFGLLGFWTYSLALERSPVSVATAPLVVGEVCGPTVVGLTLLGDQVRPGWWLALVVGLGLAVGGALMVHGPTRAQAS